MCHMGAEQYMCHMAQLLLGISLKLQRKWASSIGML